jgi:hypothetical protein
LTFRVTNAAPSSAPTRDEAIGITTHFQGLEFHLSTGVYKDVLTWSDDLSEADRFAAYQTHLNAGDRHMVCNLSALYHPGQAGISIAGSGWDYTQNLPLFKARLREMIIRGLIPLCSLAFDGHEYNPEGGTYGWQWGMNNAERIIRFLQADGDLTPYIVFFAGFELVTPPGGNWSPDELFEMYRYLRVLLPHGYLACELGGYAWPGNGIHINPVPMDSVAVMSSPEMLAIDVMLAEWNNPGDPQRQDGMEQIASRWLGPDARNIQAKNAGPWYLRVPTPRGPRVAVAFERCLAAWVRNQISSQDVAKDADAFRALGFRYVS